MGPITGYRIVNLRVQGKTLSKVAYPDITIDLRGGQHTVIGQENGGGKSTQIAFLIYVLLPYFRYFLPRRAQKKQQKAGAEKLIQEYVPGGPPTHVVLEFDLPIRGTITSTTPTRVLVGACLSKDANAGPSVKADEFFWSARCVGPDLDLAALPLRADNGKLLDAQEWRHTLSMLHDARPSAEIEIHDKKDSWVQFLKDILKIDVGFVQSWLLAMNEDEGAADHVFTYASPRDFLNSLVGAVANPQVIADLKETLVVQGADADKIRTDRRRKQLLDNFAKKVGPLADLTAQLTTIDTDRQQLIRAVLESRLALEQAARAAGTRLETAKDQQKAAEDQDRELSSAAAEAAGKETLARRQVEQLRLQQLQADLACAQAELERASALADKADVAAILSGQRTITLHIEAAQQLLADKEQDAEPLRAQASSAAQAWQTRILEEKQSLDMEGETLQAAIGEAQAETVGASSRAATATATIATLDERSATCHRRLEHLDALLAGARQTRLLEADQEPSQAIDHLASRLTERSAALSEAEDQARESDDELTEVAKALGELEGKIGTATARAESAKTQWDTAQQTTSDLTSSLTSSGLLDLADISLDDGHSLVIEMLEAVIESAHTRSMAAAVEAARSRRADSGLQETGLMPPRPDVEELCAAASRQGWNARPGWSYLATLHETIARQQALNNPGLADGIVVHVPDDQHHVISLVESQREQLAGPVCIGPPEAFTGTGAPATDVVLPNDSYWSKTAGQQQAAVCGLAFEKQQRLVDSEQHRQQQSVTLRDRVLHWRKDLGPGSVAAAAATYQDLLQECTKLTGQRAEQTAYQQELSTAKETATDTAAALRVEITSLDKHIAQLAAIRDQCAERPHLESEITTASSERESAEADLSAAVAEGEAAQQRHADAAARHTAIARAAGALEATLAKAQAAAQALHRQGDVIYPDDASADRDSLAELSRLRHERLTGAISDPVLEAEIIRLGREAENFEARLSAKLRGDRRTLRPEAEAYLNDNPAFTPDDFSAEAASARQRFGELKERCRGLTARCSEQDSKVGKTDREVERRRAPELDPSDRVTDLAVAEAIAQRWLTTLRDATTAARHASEEAAAAADQARDALAVHELIGETRDRLWSMLAMLAASGPVLPSIDLVDAEFAVTTFDVDGFPAQLRHFIGLLAEPHQHRAESLRSAASDAVSEAAHLIDKLRKARDHVESLTRGQLDDAEAMLRTIDEDLCKGDEMMQRLRIIRRDELRLRAPQINSDALGRLSALGHHIAKFDGRVQATADTAFAALQHMISTVRQTVRDSELPNTPALGRWRTMPLLKLTGLDTPKAQQRGQVLSTLQDWLDPDREDKRPAFDADETIWKLLAAMTPKLNAFVLIPSDPLDPEHKPVNTLAKETSGGEGVTVALLLASLLAARRARSNGHRRTTLLLDNPFAKVTKPMFLRLVRDVASSLGVQLIGFTGIRDAGALAVFPAHIALRVSRRETANVVAPAHLDDPELQDLIRQGTLYVSAVEREAALTDADASTWPVISTTTLDYDTQMQFDDDPTGTHHKDPGSEP